MIAGIFCNDNFVCFSRIKPNMRYLIPSSIFFNRFNDAINKCFNKMWLKIESTLNHTKSLENYGNVSETSKRNNKGLLAEEILIAIFKKAISTTVVLGFLPGFIME